MANVLLAWEMGGGLGHLMQLFPLAQYLVEKGHTVWAALKDLSRAREVFGRLNIRFVQAPIMRSRRADEGSKAMTFAHILQSAGWADARELAGLAEAWRNLLTLAKVDLVIFDHSPTALLAARGLPMKKVLIGSGFFIPPDQSPLPNLRFWAPVDAEALKRDEGHVLGTANEVIQSWGVAPLSRLAQLYAEVDERLLTTFADVDHYRERKGERYWGLGWDRMGKPHPTGLRCLGGGYMHTSSRFQPSRKY
jgi:hypothetical protein